MFKNKKFILTVLSLAILLSANFAFADSSGGAVGGTSKQLLQELDTAGTAANLSANDPRVIVANIVKTVLGLLGFVFLLLMIYAGFLWMTAAGKEDQVEKATDIIKMAVIGLAITLLSYAVTLFIINVVLLPARA